MTIDLSVWADDEQAITEELPATYRFQDGQVVIGMSGLSTSGQRLESIGFYETISQEFRALKSLFTSAPYPNMTCTDVANNRDYRVANVNDDPTGLTYQLTLVELTK